MALRWLNRQQNVANLERYRYHNVRLNHFDYNQYDDEEFRQRYKLTKEAFQEILELLLPDLEPHNDRG